MKSKTSNTKYDWNLYQPSAGQTKRFVVCNSKPPSSSIPASFPLHYIIIWHRCFQPAPHESFIISKNKINCWITQSMQEVIAWAKLNSALKERLVRAAAHCLSSHSLESTIFYGWWGTDGSQCCPRTPQWWGWKQSLKKKKCHWAGDCLYGYTVTTPAWLILKLTYLANQSTGFEALAVYYLLFMYSFFSCFTVELHGKPSGVMDFSSKLTFQQPGSHQLPQFRFNILAGGILHPKISLGESKYSFISCPFINWLTTGVCPHTLW